MTNDPKIACNETNGCSVDPCPENNICSDIKSDDYILGGKVRECTFVPFDITEKEVSIEGLGKEDFPIDLALAFTIQNLSFIFLYATLALMILIQIIAVEGGLGNTERMANKHSVALFVFIGCVVRIVYIYTTDMYPSLSPFRHYQYGLSAFNDVMWFTAFAYLAFYWWELQLKGIKQKVLNVNQTKKKMYATIAIFACFRFARAVGEGTDDLIMIASGKAVVVAYMIGFGVFTRYWGVKLLNRLKSMNARTTTSKETEGSKKKNAALKRFKNFLIWEAIAASIWIMEQGASVALKYSYLVSLSKSPMIIFAMKVTQRGTEFVMMTLLAYLVCLKTASINFTKVSLGITELQRNYVLFSHLFPSFLFALRTSVCQP